MRSLREVGGMRPQGFRLQELARRRGVFAAEQALAPGFRAAGSPGAYAT